MVADIIGPDFFIVLIVAVLVIFGGAAIPKLARNLGSAKSEFEKGLKESQASDAAKPGSTEAVKASDEKGPSAS